MYQIKHGVLINGVLINHHDVLYYIQFAGLVLMPVLVKLWKCPVLLLNLMEHGM